MTETQRPTQEETERAISNARGTVADEGRPGLASSQVRDARVLLALAAENKALEERVRVLRRALVDAAGYTHPNGYARKQADDALATDDAKAAGEPITVTTSACPRTDTDAAIEEHQRRWPDYDCSNPPDHERAHSYLMIDDWTDGEEAENVSRCYLACRGLLRELAPGEALPTWGKAKASGEPYQNGWLGTEQPDAPRRDDLTELLRDTGNLAEVERMVAAMPPPDVLTDRASLRRAYVREKAPVILAGIIPREGSYSADLYRREAIEQAGLIFDETEPKSDD